ncbi:biotin-dependent carboxyltransferase family protein [Bryobacter aggregatus]|uniref:5-oxoprolinase subunit C family protein n=1 Tax=Bryobacter aggregatus TaxID=360054 RepID=UPI0004E12B70|nr:biotin-dependent carboxyltransferase family protein [Bryobacter aggregatus]
MVNPGIRILDPGFLTTIQDQPRFGLARYGLSEAGPMASVSYFEANYLAGNDEPQPGIEVTMKPARLLFTGATRIGISGADFGWRLDGRPISMHQSIEVRAGSTLQGDYCRTGLRGYIACNGGIQITRWQGSAATHVQSGLGGQKLERGAELKLALPVAAPPRFLREHPHSPLLNGSAKVLRIVDGPHASLFPPESMSLFLGTSYKVTELSSRMAIRIDGLQLSAPREPLLSTGAWHGAIQVPPSGIPQVLGTDHPATGGYPILGSVIRADLEVLGQLRPREEIRFGRVSLETARALYKRMADAWRALSV